MNELKTSRVSKKFLLHLRSNPEILIKIKDIKKLPTHKQRRSNDTRPFIAHIETMIQRILLRTSNAPFLLERSRTSTELQKLLPTHTCVSTSIRCQVPSPYRIQARLTWHRRLVCFDSHAYIILPRRRVGKHLRPSSPLVAIELSRHTTITFDFIRERERDHPLKDGWNRSQTRPFLKEWRYAIFLRIILRVYPIGQSTLDKVHEEDEVVKHDGKKKR